MRESGGKWIILRTAARCTLPLARSLAEDGFEVWTPSEANRKRGRRGKERVPIMPTYVFANARQLWRLVGLSENPRSRHDAFSVFRHINRFPIVPDCQLEPLRSTEIQLAPDEERPVYSKGEPVHVADPGWGGLSGVVDQPGREYTLVLFPLSPRPVKIRTFLLRPDEAYQFSNATDAVAA